MTTHSLKANLKKCSFGATSIHYLGHIIAQAGVHTEPDKIQAVLDWAPPKTLKQLRGFLGLTGYYRRFIKDYGKICKPLTNLLKKDAFQWDSAAGAAFDSLKKIMTSPPVLALPNFLKPFLIETDASGKGMGAVSMQDGHPIAYISKAFSNAHLLLSAYERELLAIVFAVQKWQHYLMMQPFIIRTDQQSLKYLLDHKLATPFQQKWLSKLAGFDYVVEYKVWADYKAADALSWAYGYQLLSIALSNIDSALLTNLQQFWATDPHIHQLIAELTQDPLLHPHYTWQHNLLKRKGKIMVGPNLPAQQLILKWMHDSPQGGHSGIEATLQRIKTLFYWPRLKQSVASYIKQCQVC